MSEQQGETAARKDTRDVKLDIKKALSAFHVICEKGEKNSEGVFVYKQFHASSDFDGYTLFIDSHGVSLQINFHNTYDVHFERSDQLTLFIEKLYLIAQEPTRSV